jgi:hypothetical protein
MVARLDLDLLAKVQLCKKRGKELPNFSMDYKNNSLLQYIKNSICIFYFSVLLIYYL